MRKRDSVEPVAKQVGIANRRRLVGQDEKDGLEGILSVMLVNQKLAAKPEYHRSVAINQRSERSFTGRAPPGDESLYELPVRQSGNGPAVEE